MDITEIRTRNLQLLEHDLRARLGGKGKPAPQKDAAIALDLSPSYLSQLMGGKKMGDDVARKIEQSQGLPKGWMDVLQGAGNRVAESATVAYLPSQAAGRADITVRFARAAADRLANERGIDRGSDEYLIVFTEIRDEFRKLLEAEVPDNRLDLAGRLSPNQPEETSNAERREDERDGEHAGRAAVRKAGKSTAKRPKRR